ncbi:cytochrome P450 [Hypoxylon cercidicola]|nr:cytochrome P450 [Hypoxylon cercidicola]
MASGMLAVLWHLLGQQSLSAAFLWAVVVFGAVRFYTDPLRHIPGPFAARLTPLWLWHIAWNGTEARSVARLHRKHGPVVRVAPNEVDVSDGAATHPIYVKTGGLLKSPAYRNFDMDGFPTIFSVVDPVRRATRAKAVAPVFAQQAIMKGRTVMMKIVDEVVEELGRRKAAANGKPVDLLNLFRSLALNASSSYLFGDAFGSVREEKLKAAAFVNDFVAVGSLFYLPGWIYERVSHWSAKFNENKSDIAASSAVVDGFATRMVDNSIIIEREEGRTYQGRLLKVGISREETIAQVKDLIFAGIDSTGTNMSMLCFYLRRSPEKYERARKEVLDNPDVDAHSLPYVSGVVKETLRLSMANPSRLPRTVSSTGLQVAGLPSLPAGTGVGLSAYMLHHNPDVFPNPYKFLPERWLEPFPEMLRDSFYFGAGPRQCIARNLASAELLWLAAALLRSDVLCGSNPVEDKIEIREWFNSSVISGKIELVWR